VLDFRRNASRVAANRVRYVAVTLANPFVRFRELHSRTAPLLLPNAWDFASAAVFAEAGYLAIGTTSLGIAAAAGKLDATGAIRTETVTLVRRLAMLPVLTTVDVESGFSDDPEAVADLAVELVEAGAVGINLEDGSQDGSLIPSELQVRKIQAIKRRVPDLFVNARTDTFWLEGSVPDPLAETLRRGAAVADAGADGFFVPGEMSLEVISQIASEVPLPLNVLHRPNVFNRDLLCELGVARASTGSLLFRHALNAAHQMAADFNPKLPQPISTATPSYAEVQHMLIRYATTAD
jgi:2-methylisocitrate lyase-like PEP mutase family enzyme